MSKSNFTCLLAVLGLAFGIVACGDDSGPTAPSEVPDPNPEPPAVTLTGTWMGPVTGNLVDGEATVELTQDEQAMVTGEWQMPMPAALVAAGAPPNVPLAGGVSGTVSGSTAELVFGFLAAYATQVGADCAIDVTVTTFSETMAEGDWATGDGCFERVDDNGTLTLTRQ